MNQVMAEDAFITSIGTLRTSTNAKSEDESDKLRHVRKDHNQLMDVVEQFGSKVSIM